jgi:hypothetical protein
MPPCNWVVFAGEAALLFLGEGLIFALNCMFWLAWLGQSSLILPLVLPYAALMLCAVVVTAARNRALRAGANSLDVQFMLRLNQMQLASRVSYFFAFPLAFYGLISLGQAITYALLLKQGLPSALPRVSGNSLQTSGIAYISVGEPQLQTQDQFDHYLATSVLAPSSLDLAVIGVVVAAIVIYLGVFRYWTLLGINSASGSLPVDRARRQGASRVPVGRGRAAILAQWMFMLMTNLLGAAVMLIVVLWVTHRYIYGPVLEGNIILPMSALVWYKTVITMKLGQAVAAGLLALLIIPGVLSVMIWAYSLATRIWLAVRVLLRGRRRAARRLSGIRLELRRITGRRLPPIRLDKQLIFPKTEAFLPFCWACVIRLPQHCVENMNDARLKSVIAHEIVHVREHARRLWWLEFLSWLTITGPGLLTSLLDFTAMEFRADEMALQWTKDRCTAVEALEYFQSGTWAGDRGYSGGAMATGVGHAMRKTVRPSLARFRTTFFVFWAFQPAEEAVPIQERIDRIAGYGA